MATEFVTISVNILRDTNLTANEKFILAEITQLCSLEHGCYASNQHFADLIGIARANASRVITSLTTKAYITTEIKAGTRNRERSIKLISRSIKTSSTCYQNDNEVVSKRQETKENIQTNIQLIYKEFENLNLEAFTLWCEYKGKKYTKLGMRLSAKKLAEHPHEIQTQMVNNSIEAGYKGLFAPKNYGQKATVRNDNRKHIEKFFDVQADDEGNVIDVEFTN